MSASQKITTTTTTVRGWKQKDDTKKSGSKVAKAYSAQLKSAKSSKQTKQRRCPTCGRPL